MGIFGGDSGPSEAEINQKNLDRAKQREQTVRSNAQQVNNQGIVQLFGPGNPALNILGGNGA